MFDFRLHPESLSDADLDTLLQFGVHHALLVGPCAAHDTSADGLIAGFEALLRQQQRCKKHGLHTWLAMGVHPSSLPKRGLARVLDEIPKLAKPTVLRAIGPIGVFNQQGAQTDAFEAQVQLAQTLGLPVLVTLPARRKDAALRLSLQALKKLEFTPTQVCIDGVSVKTVRTVLSLGHLAGLTVHPEYLTPDEAVALVNALGPSQLMVSAAAGHGVCDIVSLALTAHRMERASLSAAAIRRVTKENAARWLSVAL